MQFLTATHIYALIPTFLVFVGVALILSRILRGRAVAPKMIPWQIAAVLLLMMVYPTVLYGNDAIRREWSGYFVFHTVATLAVILVLTLKFSALAHKREALSLLYLTMGVCSVSFSLVHLAKDYFEHLFSGNAVAMDSIRAPLQRAVNIGLSQVIYVLVISGLNILLVKLSHRFPHLLGRKHAAARAEN